MEGIRETPPPLMDLYISSTDTLRGRLIDQTMPASWNDRPPLFKVEKNEKRLWRIATREGECVEEEDPASLKDVRDDFVVNRLP